MKPLTVGSLFSGIGGLELGLERAGMKVRWQVEIEEYPRRVLAKHWPDVPKYEDVRDVGAHVLEPVDLICGGFPCQDLSKVRRGQITRGRLDGEKSGLWNEYARIVREIRPRFVFVENVTDLLYGGLDRVLGDLAELGYDAEWRVLAAVQFAAPHIRERLFLVAYPSGFRDGLPENALFAGRSGTQHDPWWASEPGVRRVDDGVPARVDRLRALGNAVVPQVAEWIGRRIVEADAAMRESEAA